MKALTLYQPYATLLALNLKGPETRSWATNYRGPVAIHAAKNFPAWARELCRQEPFLSVLRKAGIIGCDLPLGCIVGQAKLQTIFRITPGGMVEAADNRTCGYFVVRQLPGEPERSFGDYRPGRFAWDFIDPQHFEPAIPARGAQGLWDWQAPWEVAS
ncbi:MAG: 2-oxoglutarate dehydrogenase E1 [Ammonifex sp.]|jgi:hypothetical protein|nr:MAG: 2-oxoglutarate dehydrogenase E1 [Ammonifex sp.]